MASKAQKGNAALGRMRQGTESHYNDCTEASSLSVNLRNLGDNESPHPI